MKLEHTVRYISLRIIIIIIFTLGSIDPDG